MKKIYCLLLALLCLCGTTRAQLLWKVSGKGLEQPSYIMGTYHLAKVAFVDSVPGLRDALAASEQVYGELDMQALMSNPELSLQMQQYMMLPEGTSLDGLLTAEQLQRLNEFLRNHMGADLENPMMAQLKLMKPAALQQQLTVLLCLKLEQGFNPQEQFDTYFQKVAAEQHKAVGGLEQPDFQFNILFNQASLERQVEQLMCLVDDAAYTQQMLQRIIKAFYAQDMQTLQQLNDEKRHNQCDSTPAEEEALIYGRNANWAEALPCIMEQKSTFVAVGALHLPGPRGLLQQLRDKGYTVTPVTAAR